ncbi:MAG: hypothetical protein WBP45_01525 [Daejeonella sp.]
MQQLEDFMNKYPSRVFIFLMLLALPAFFTNLGLLPLFADEPTRANVALEMIITKNYAVPTIGGEFYYNKPPFYNWILAGFYLLTGSFSEFVTRLPAIIPLFLFAITIYYSVSYFLKDKRIAVLSGIFFLVNGRMLIYDSMLGHIDIFYSWLTYCSFMLIFYFYQCKQWFLLFFISYIITAITFLCKGIPSLLFQGFTLIALLIYTKNIRKLISWQHILSGIVCLLLIGAYFYNYYQYNPNLKGYFETIWEQSSRRVNTGGGWWQKAEYILTFPFQHLMHLFPVSLLVIFCLHKNFLKNIMQHEFLKYITLIFLANIWVYWLSPETRPRYLLMLYPLVLIVWSYAYYTWRDKLPRLNKLFEIILLAISILVTLAVPAAFFFGLKAYVSFLPLKVCVIFFSCALLSWFIYQLRSQKIIAFIALLLMVRLAFSWFILPHRHHNLEEAYFRNAAIEMGTLVKNTPFYFYQYHPDDPAIPFHDRLIFYIERTRMQQVRFTETAMKPGYYFTFDRDLENPHAQLLKTYRNNLKLYRLK